jgi:signal transduction histidine kinase
MKMKPVIRGAGPQREASRAGPGAAVIAGARGLALCVLAAVSAFLLLALPLAMGGVVHAVIDSTLGFELGFGLGLLLIPGSIMVMRPLLNLTRWLVGHWSGVPIGAPYLPLPGHGRHAGFRVRLEWLLRDPATWRDVLWVAVSPGVSLIVAVAAWADPRLLRGYGRLARSMLSPTRQAELALRVHHLAQTRADTIDAGAAEMRRIERDLHDGAQARLVAMGMTLDAASHVLLDDPAAALALLAEARESSARALAELRDLVRGIHPPVLADRGLAEAVRALALDLPLRVHVVSELTGRAPVPVESAAYFAVSELLANVSKHAHAGQVWIDLRHDGGMLRVDVTDDGAGGADPARGTGLAGIERRLAAFDGLLAVSSPQGGPTAVNMEIPCALPAADASAQAASGQTSRRPGTSASPAR